RGSVVFLVNGGPVDRFLKRKSQIFARPRRSYAISRALKPRNPTPPPALSWRRTSCLPQFEAKTLGLGRSGVFFHWSNRMVVKAIRQGAAVDERAPISLPARQD